jgi:hypothetical protein
MTNFQGALEAALYARLTAQVTLAPVHQHVPDNLAPPVVIIGDINSENIGAKDRPLLRFDITIVSVVTGPGRKPLNAVQAEVLAALGQWMPAATADVAFGDLQFQTGSGRLLPSEEPIYYGEQVFVVIIQATDT